MKVAITSRGPDLTSDVDPRFGRARYFVIADTETRDTTPVDNDQNLNAAQGAGIQAAQNVASYGVEAVITGHCGPKAFSALAAGGIKIYTGATGTVADAIDQLNTGTLAQANAPDVAGHW